MAKHPKIRLSRLRDIGWRPWDPIGLSGLAPADEYDGYLLKVAGMVCRNEDDDAAAQYLVWAESEHMGMGVRADTQSRAEATIASIRADDELGKRAKGQFPPPANSGTTPFIKSRMAARKYSWQLLDNIPIG
jgi:hypothetical protein